MPDTTFHYPKLGSAACNVRLLKVIPRQESDCLTLCLEPAKLERSQFVALSYTWHRSVLARNWRGAPIRPVRWKPKADEALEIVSVNGAEFSITPNLHQFLEAIETTKLNGKWFYVDQICINQNDRDEVGQQVALMGEIYSRADEVVAWFPPPPESLNDSVRMLSGDEELKALLKCPKSHHAPASQRTVQVERAKKIGRELEPCLRSTYWLRQWIVQEVMLAQQLVFQVGPYDLDWEIAFNVIAQFPSDEEAIALELNSEPAGLYHRNRGENVMLSSIYCLRLLKHKQQSRGLRPRLFEALVQFGGRECTKQRDGVYGLVGLANTSIKPYGGIPLSLLYLQVLYEGINHMTAESRGREFFQFVYAARSAVGYNIWDLTVALITSRVLANSAVEYKLRKIVIMGVGLLQDSGTVPIFRQKLRYAVLEQKLRRAKASNKPMGIADVDHQTGIWRTETKSYNEWLELVDSMTPGPIAQDWKGI